MRNKRTGPHILRHNTQPSLAPLPKLTYWEPKGDARKMLNSVWAGGEELLAWLGVSVAVVFRCVGCLACLFVGVLFLVVFVFLGVFGRAVAFVCFFGVRLHLCFFV